MSIAFWLVPLRRECSSQARTSAGGGFGNHPAFDAILNTLLTTGLRNSVFCRESGLDSAATCSPLRSTTSRAVIWRSTPWSMRNRSVYRCLSMVWWISITISLTVGNVPPRSIALICLVGSL